MASNEYEYLLDEVEAELLPNLARFVRIANQSREFDPEWETNGLLKKAATFVVNWAAQQELARFKIEIMEEAGRTPTILATIDAPAAPEKTVLIYGHIDKQPPLTEQWHDGKTPYVPVYENGKLYGRGSGDDGYAFFTAVLLVKTLQKYNLQKHRFVLVFESDEESDSKDLIYFLQKRAEMVGKPDVVLCLDSGTVSYDRLCLTSSIRGILDVTVTVSVAQNSVHSGDASGIIPDSFRIIRHLLKSFENSSTGAITIEAFNPNIPENCYRDAQQLIHELGPDFKYEFPFLPGVEPTAKTVFEQYINSTWKPQMTMIGINGIPSTSNAGNVVRPATTLDLSFRLPPNLPAQTALEAFQKHLASTAILYNAKLETRVKSQGNGFMADKLPEDLSKRLDDASQRFFGKSSVTFGEAGSIPFMGDFKNMYPKAVFVVTGIMGPNSNAHGPNEFAEISYLKKFLCSLLYVFRGN